MAETKSPDGLPILAAIARCPVCPLPGELGSARRHPVPGLRAAIEAAKRALTEERQAP